MDAVGPEEKSQRVKEAIIQRDQDRKEKIKNLREDKDYSPSELTKVFDVTFDGQTERILDSIKFIEEKNVDQGKLPEYLNSLKQDINSLNKLLSESIHILSNYNVKKRMDTVQGFENRLQQLEAEYLPRKKFVFKKKKKAEVVKPVKVSDKVVPLMKDEVDSVTSKLVSLSAISCGFSERKNESLKLTDDEINKKDVELRNLDNCVVFLHGSPGTVHISNINQCKILSGPVSTSVLIENCSSCDIVVACQQIRIHSAKDSRFYIHITSRVVIEDTHNAQFAPYNLEYKELEKHFQESGLNRSLNNWNVVDDFDWLVRKTKSPNWSEINVDDRVLNWTTFLDM